MNYSNIILIVCCVFVFSCSSKEENSFFNGELIHIDISAQTDTLKGDAIVLEDEGVGMISVLDSLIFFYNPIDKRYSYHCYNYKTGKHIADFFPIGRGHNEFLNVTPIHCISMCNDTAKSVFVALNEQKSGIFNITRSISEKKTVLEDVRDFEWKKHFTNPITQIYPYKDKLIVLVNGRKTHFKHNTYMLPQYVFWDKKTLKPIDTITFYKKALTKELHEELDMNLFRFFGILKPDRTKMASIMGYLPQISILDIESGSIKEIRYGETTLWDLLAYPTSVARCHSSVAVDDNYIYLPWFIDGEITKGTHIVNVFSWEGKHVMQYYIEEPFDQIQIDSKSNVLLAYNQFTNRLYRYTIPNK